MARSFGRTLRSLETEGYRGRFLPLLLPVALVTLWACWLFLARVSVFAVSITARLESVDAVHPVQTPVGGRVVASHLVLGTEVEVGQVLVELDSQTERLQLREEEARRVALVGQVVALRAQILAKDRSSTASGTALQLALAEAEQRLREAEARSRLSADEAARSEQLRQDGLVSDLELVRARTEAQKSAAVVATLRLTWERLRAEQRAREGGMQGEAAELRGRLAAVEGQAAAIEESIARLKETIAKRTVRAPATGRLAEIIDIDAGAIVAEGARLAAIVPRGSVRIVAYYQPHVALGRVRPGQPARLRLHGFPWTQFGSLSARVERVAGEPHEGRVRVELATSPEPGSPITIEHGLPGDVEIEVERVSPATLLLRSAGRIAGSPAAVPSDDARSRS